MPIRPDTADYRQLLLEDAPLLDTRAPVEFAGGAFPTAVNLPLMTDDERHQIGTCYKEKGQQAAIALGHQLVSGPIKAERVAAWANFAQDHPQGYLYCFRGGLRSQISQQWLADAGVPYPRVIGGYKAMRRFLLDWLAANIDKLPIYIVSGRTGSGKTELIDRLPNAVDLEGRANHRGSSFGRQLTPQPPQISFENSLTIDLLKANPQQPIFLEDEGHLIGRSAIPLVLREKMAKAPLLLLEADLSERVERILQDYVVSMQAGFAARDGVEAGWQGFCEHLLSGLQRVEKRLGGERYQQISKLMKAALEAQQQGDLSGHRLWIQQLLHDYYDPMYDYQLSRKQGRILARGHHAQLLAWAARLAQ